MGNCTVSTIEENSMGDSIIQGGRIHMLSPFSLITSGAKFAFNGMLVDRGVELDSYLHTGPLTPGSQENLTTGFYLTSPSYEVEDGHLTERLIPSKMVRYMTERFNQPEAKVHMNIFHFSSSPGDFALYDISACYGADLRLHLMIRMGWSPAMDIEGTELLFRARVREAVVIWGMVTPLRVTSIKYSIDPDHSAFYLIFTVLDTPPSEDIELNDMEDAVRPNTEVLRNIKGAVDKGWFKVTIFTNDGKGGKVDSVAEKGSTRVMGERGGRYTHTVGYSSGAMAALGLVVLLLTIGGVLALLKYVLKW